jgi:hypothetical protein
VNRRGVPPRSWLGLPIGHHDRTGPGGGEAFADRPPMPLAPSVTTATDPSSSPGASVLVMVEILLCEQRSINTLVD